MVRYNQQAHDACDHDATRINSRFTPPPPLKKWGSKGRVRVNTSAPVGDPDPYLWVYILSKLKPRSV